MKIKLTNNEPLQLDSITNNVAKSVDLARDLLTTSDISEWAMSSTKPTYTASEVGALPSNTHIPADLKVGSVAGKLYRNNVGGTGNFSISGNSGCIPNLIAGTFLVAIYAKSSTQSYTFRFNFGSTTYDLSTTNGEINDLRTVTISSAASFSGSVVTSGGVASGTILYVTMYDYLTPIQTVGPAAVTNRYSDLDGTPTIPTVNNGTLTIQKEGTSIGTFTANASSNSTINVVESDPVYSASAAAGITSSNISEWNGKQDVLTAGDGIAIDSNDTIRTTGIPYGECDSTSTATAFTATVPGIYKLEDGVCCLLKNGVVTSASGFTIDVNGLGAKPSYSNMATGNTVTPTDPTRDTTIFNINYVMLFIYSETIVSGGGWICYRGYDANTNTIGYQVRSNSMSLPASQKFYRYRLLFTSADGTHFVPANTSSSTNATSSRTVNQTPIDPFGHIVYYSSTTAINAESNPGATALWVIYTLSLGYSFNRTGAALTLTSWAPVYIKCAPQADGSAIMDSTTPYVQALPSTADGKIYIFLGVAYSATQIELLNSHPVYYHDGTGIRLWTGKDGYTKSEVDTALSNRLKYVLCVDESDYESIVNKDSTTLYLIPESNA